jgi:putative spermidine/putrescine transport system ATP-binding protein
MADRLVVMAGGRVQQVGTQRELYERPATAFVAGFVGRTNFLRGRLEAPGRFVSDGGLVIRCPADAAGGVLALRPERLAVATAPVPGSDNCLRGTVEFVSYLGGTLEYYVRVTPGDRLVVQEANRMAAPVPAVGAGVYLHWPAEAGLVLADDGGGAS